MNKEEKINKLAEKIGPTYLKMIEDGVPEKELEAFLNKHAMKIATPEKKKYYTPTPTGDKWELRWGLTIMFLALVYAIGECIFNKVPSSISINIFLYTGLVTGFITGIRSVIEAYKKAFQ